jgi:hypothetical protein
MHLKKWSERLTLLWRRLQLRRRRRLLCAQGLPTKIYGEWLVIEGRKRKALGLSPRVFEKRKRNRKNRQRMQSTVQLAPYYFYAPY